MITDIDEALRRVDQAEEDCTADMGEEAVEAGGWVELTRSVMLDCTPDVAAEVARRKGLTLNGEVAPGDPI